MNKCFINENFYLKKYQLGVLSLSKYKRNHYDKQKKKISCRRLFFYGLNRCINKECAMRRIIHLGLIAYLSLSAAVAGSANCKPLWKESGEEPAMTLIGKTRHNAAINGYMENFNISRGAVGPITDFDGKTSIYLGTASRVEDSVAYQTEKKTTYKSGWTGEVIRRTYDVKRFDTYVFSRYVNIPVRIVDRLELMPGASIDYTCEHLYQTTFNYSETLSSSYEFTREQSTKLGLHFGISTLLDLLKIGGEAKVEGTISTSEKITKTASQTWSKSVTYAEQTSSTWPLKNEAPGERRVYQFNYRQKFQLYITTEYNLLYKEGSYHDGLFNLDTHYTHELIPDKYEAVETHFFMIPVDLPTLGFTEYHNSSDGREFPTTLIENNVLYL